MLAVSIVAVEMEKQEIQDGERETGEVIRTKGERACRVRWTELLAECVEMEGASDCGADHGCCCGDQVRDSEEARPKFVLWRGDNRRGARSVWQWRWQRR